MSSSPDTIRLDGLTLDTIVGLLPQERVVSQPLVVALELELDITRTAQTGDLGYSVDYARLADEVAFILQAGRFKLLETAALALCHYLLTPPVDKDLAATAAQVTLSKPQALGGRAMPSVSVRRRCEQVRSRDEAFGVASLARIFESDEAGLYRLQRWPGDTSLPSTRSYARSAGLDLSPTARLIVLSQ